ncbi:hypothetical protein LOCC1_G005460 [Lachnellula occidentalis]|uniref:FAR-17a/AIG1-like protein n=1 Tax=Lachnellula occidentalis TaxID=215460 RepID=A0A8H8U6Q7_9HELO|nr:hypothetical protein LOCC1_G005460 [Lachnellula occidentalis]
MSSTTPLLPRNKKDEHPIFLRVCHSPWTGIGQNTLVGLRGLTAIYMTVSFILMINYDVNFNNAVNANVNKDGWSTVFDPPNIAYFMLTLYQWMAAIWTFMHLHYPHHRNGPQNASTRVQRFLSPPRQQESTKNKTWFSVFYYAALTFPHLTTLIHWAISVPMNQTAIPANAILGNGRYADFFVITKYAIVSLVALLEVFVYSSIRRPTPPTPQIAGISLLALLYIGWAYVGHEITGRYPYYFLDHRTVGPGNTAGAIIAFVAAANILFGFNLALTALRELLAHRSEQRSSGYTSLPQ